METDMKKKAKVSVQLAVWYIYSGSIQNIKTVDATPLHLEHGPEKKKKKKKKTFHWLQ